MTNQIRSQEEFAQQARAITNGEDSYENLFELLFEAQQCVPGLAQFVRDKCARAGVGSTDTNDEEICDMLQMLVPGCDSAKDADPSGEQPPPHSRHLEKPPADDSFFGDDVKKAELKARR